MIITVLQFAPCADSPETLEVNQTAYTQNNSGAEHIHQEDCTPFCYCYCCSVPLASPMAAALAFDVFETTTTYQEHSSDKFINVSRSIWQPPQLA